MKSILALQKMEVTQSSKKILKSSVSQGCRNSSNTSWFFC